ncbi:MAG: hypothetical protein BME94_08530 [Methanobacteriales archaeon Met13]
MKKIVAVLLVTFIIGMSPAFAAEISSANQTLEPLNIKGKGIEADADSQTMGNLEICETKTDDATTKNPVTAAITMETDNSTVDHQIKENHDTEITDLNYLENKAVIDTTGIVMQTTNYTCGPAALATVLNNLGINATEQELTNIAGTDENGTTMYGLAEAAKAKGLKAIGMKLSVDELKPNNIVFITVNGGPHYSVVREVTENSVKLADTSLGNIEMSKEKFDEVYSGNALVVSDPNATSQEAGNLTRINGTAEQLNNETNQTSGNTISSELVNNTTNVNSINVQSENSKTLTTEEMQSIKGKNWKYRLNKRLKKQGKWKRGQWYSRGFNWPKAYWYGAAGLVVVGCIASGPKGWGFLAAIGTAYGGYRGDPYYNQAWMVDMD